MALRETYLYNRQAELLIQAVESVEATGGLRYREGYYYNPRTDAFDADGRIQGLRTVFSVEKTTPGEPNTARIQIYNLSERTRQSIFKDFLLTLRAGYRPIEPTAFESTPALPQVFKGNIRFVATERQGPDLMTTLECGDGETAIRGARINLRYIPGTPSLRIFNDLTQKLKDFGVEVITAISEVVSGYLDRATSEPSNIPDADAERLVQTTFQRGQSLMGSAWDEYVALCNRHGLDLSIQDNILQITPKDSTTDTEPLEVSVNTGLIGTPSKNQAGGINFQHLLSHEFSIGRRINLTSQLISGVYKIDRLRQTGDTHGPSWYSYIETVQPTAVRRAA